MPLEVPLAKSSSFSVTTQTDALLGESVLLNDTSASVNNLMNQPVFQSEMYKSPVNHSPHYLLMPWPMQCTAPLGQITPWCPYHPYHTCSTHTPYCYYPSVVPQFVVPMMHSCHNSTRQSQLNVTKKTNSQVHPTANFTHVKKPLVKNIHTSTNSELRCGECNGTSENNASLSEQRRLKTHEYVRNEHNPNVLSGATETTPHEDHVLPSLENSSLSFPSEIKRAKNWHRKPRSMFSTRMEAKKPRGSSQTSSLKRELDSITLRSEYDNSEELYREMRRKRKCSTESTGNENASHLKLCDEVEYNAKKDEKGTIFDHNVRDLAGLLKGIDLKEYDVDTQLYSDIILRTIELVLRERNGEKTPDTGIDDIEKSDSEKSELNALKPVDNEVSNFEKFAKSVNDLEELDELDKLQRLKLLLEQYSPTSSNTSVLTETNCGDAQAMLKQFHNDLDFYAIKESGI